MIRRVRARIGGVVQGVGFRPFVFGVATTSGLAGFVQNDSNGVLLEVEGSPEVLQQALETIQNRPPNAARIVSFETFEIAPKHSVGFEILASQSSTGGTRISPDLATCAECIKEVFDTSNRRYLYPFTNCTDCGPRFSIIQSIPYDRQNTTMSGFPMCEACLAEYQDPLNRRFHAQPNACPDCGPTLRLFRADGVEVVGSQSEILKSSRAALKAGEILAVKGIGGFHLLCDARNPSAVLALRTRKQRPDKPLAVMFRDLEAVKKVCELGDSEAALLQGPQAPIVLIEGNRTLAPGINPINARTGAFLAHSPLHHLLLTELDAVVATSANLSAEPVCTRLEELLEDFGGVFDLALDHDRPIARPVEDTVLEVFEDKPLFHRVGRGHAPTVVGPSKGPDALALGGHLKSAIAIRVNGEVVSGSHIGDLVGPAARARFTEAFQDLPALLNAKPEHTFCDLHPDYFSSHVGESLHARPIQHHEAHVAAVMLEHGLESALGVAWDGTGLGLDQTVWGGEFFVVDGTSFERTHIQPYQMHAGDQAMREPWRAGHAVCRLLKIPWPPLPHLSPYEVDVLDQSLQLHGIQTTSVGRIFDALASLAGGLHFSTFEAHAAQVVQAAAERYLDHEDIPEFARGDWPEVFRWALDTVQFPHAAWRLHAGLASLIEAEAKSLAKPRPIVLSGGCFQNRLLLRMSVDRLRAHGFEVFWPTRCPPGDGGLAVGQLARGLKQCV